MKKLMLFIISACFYLNSLGIEPMRHFKVNFIDRKYDKLTLACNTSDLYDAFKGESQDGTNWEFVVPDSIYQRSMYVYLIPDRTDTTIQYINISDIQNNLNSFCLELPIDKTLTLHYKNTRTVEKSPFQHNRVVIFDVFTCDNPESVVFNTKYLTLSDSSYSSNLERYASFVKQNPNSKFALCFLSNCIENYQSKNDVRYIYDNFSVAAKESYFGKFLDHYLNDDTFVNFALPNAVTAKIENVIVADKKPTFVLFSASWCAPCHKITPLYKQLYAEIGDKLDFVYITIDAPKTLDSWVKLMEEEQIPWRSLAAKEQADEIMRQLVINGVPSSILVMPDKSITRLDIRQESDMVKLRELVDEM